MIPAGWAAQVLDAWRDLESSMARTFVALVEAIPEDDPDERHAAVASLVRGLPGQLAETAELIEVSGKIVELTIQAEIPEALRRRDPEADQVLDELAGFPPERSPDADR